MSDWLVTTEWLSAHLAEPGLVVVDCSWYLPEAGKHGIDDFRRAHIPGARFIDLGAVSDPDSPYVNMLPSAELWSREVGRLGIDNDTTGRHLRHRRCLARLWWMFRVFGHERVRILDGGFSQMGGRGPGRPRRATPRPS